MLKYLFGTWFFVIALYLNGLSQVIIESYLRDHINRDTLFDIGFATLPLIRDSTLADSSTVFALVLGVVPNLVFHGDRALIVKRLLLCQGSFYLVRAFAIVSTILPNPEKTCKPSSISGTEAEIIPFEALKVIAGQRITCGDVLFSGHAGAITVAALAFQEYSDGFIHDKLVRLALVVYLWVIACIGYLVIIATRFHYTIDVCVAIFVTVTIFKIYHYWTKLERFRLLEWYEDSGSHNKTVELIEEAFMTRDKV